MEAFPTVGLFAVSELNLLNWCSGVSQRKNFYLFIFISLSFSPSVARNIEMPLMSCPKHLQKTVLKKDYRQTG